MSISAAQASTFYREIAESKLIWGIKDAGGFPAPTASDGRRAMPFWSSESRALSVIRNVRAYNGFTPVSIPWLVFCERWVPGLKNDELLVGVNWSGARASGFDISPEDLQRNVDALHPGT